jgi:hypothetical protein
MNSSRDISFDALDLDASTFDASTFEAVDSLESVNTARGGYTTPIHHTDTSMFSSGYDVLNNAGNILAEFLTDEQFSTLRRLNLLNEKSLRDYHIRKTFREMRRRHVSAHHAIERLQQMYSYLQFDTLRKIVYQINDKDKQ